MKTFTVKPTSWHYKLNKKMLGYDDVLYTESRVEKYLKSKDNFCSYWRMTLKNLLKIAVPVTGILIILFLIVMALATNPYAFVKGMGLALVAIAFIFGFAYVLYRMDERRKRKIELFLQTDETETSLAKAKYSSWKNKVCLPVKFE